MLWPHQLLHLIAWRHPVFPAAPRIKCMLRLQRTVIARALSPLPTFLGFFQPQCSLNHKLSPTQICIGRHLLTVAKTFPPARTTSPCHHFSSLRFPHDSLPFAASALSCFWLLLPDFCALVFFVCLFICSMRVRRCEGLCSWLCF